MTEVLYNVKYMIYLMCSFEGAILSIALLSDWPGGSAG